jgi:hypothetical protein
MRGRGFGLAVKLMIEDKSLAQAELAALARHAHGKGGHSLIPAGAADHSAFAHPAETLENDDKPSVRGFRSWPNARRL